MNAYVLIIILVAVIAVREWVSIRHSEERKELYDRIMASGLDEYQQTRKQEPPKGRGFLREATARHEQYLKKLRKGE